ncbi:NIF-domain-containing protein [Cristinia sonorae]|uniref:NIF-domain-containing protein n=1 Tax=Cristinia sonorae TaxID=1940300 RepID=A0A8K0UX29_9AGAR|nr:NIF-domain-containing protein [Cristinia sonorae]
MNSLTYLSRQFDVLASARTPPSTPSTESLPLLPDDGDDYRSLKRVSTWSTKSFLTLPYNSGLSDSSSSSGSSWVSLKRSYSSPAEVRPATPTSTAPSTSSAVSSSRRPSVSSSKRPSRSSSRRPSLSSSEKATRSKHGSVSLLRRMVVIRIFLSLWNYIYDGWKTLTGQNLIMMAQDVVLEEGTSEEEKETEDEGNDDSALVVDEPSQPTADPPIRSPLATSHPPQYPNPVTRANTVPAIPTEPSIFVVPTSPANALPVTSIAPPGELSRTPTPTTIQRKALLHRPKTLVLDLDETLIHSTSRPMPYSNGGMLSSLGIGKKNKGSGYTVEVFLGGQSKVYHVYKRPFVDYFLRKVSAWYTLVIFTASMREYADPVIDWLDAGRGILERRFFRESCTQLANGAYTKDLSIVEEDLSLVCLVDNSPICYTINEANGIPIEGWTHDPHDEALLDLLPFLDSLRFTKDVRRVLGIRGFS